MAAEPNPVHEDDRKLFVGGLPQVKTRTNNSTYIFMLMVYFNRRPKILISRSILVSLERLKTST